MFAIVATSIALLAVERASQRRLLRSREMLQATRTAQALVSERESAIRGYIITADPRALTREIVARTPLSSMLDSLRALTRDDLDQHDRVAQLETAITRWDREFAQPVLTGQVALRDAARLHGIAGKDLFDPLRAKFAEIIAVENAAYGERRKRRDSLAVSGTGLGLLEIFAMVFVLARFRAGIIGQAKQVLSQTEEIHRQKQVLEDQALRLEGLRELEEKLRHSQKLEAMGRLAAGVAHDFNNLLTVISSYSEMVLTDWKPDDPRRKDIEEIRNAAHRATDLTGQLLAFSRKQVSNPTAVNLNEVIGHLENTLKRLIGENVALVTTLYSPLGTVVIDSGQLERLVMNLATNARDAMPDGGTLTIATRNTDWMSDEHESGPLNPATHVELRVSDTGGGIPAGVLPHIFEPFFTTKEQGKGTGIGLATVCSIAEAAAGVVDVTSESGRGTTFTFTFPIDGVPGAASSAAAGALALGGTETILLVEDQERIRHLVTRTLSASGYTIIAAKNGTEAVRLCAALLELDLLVTVVPMQGAREAAVVDLVRSRHPRARVLLISGYPGEEESVGPGTAGHAVLARPFTAYMLRRKIRETLDSPARVPNYPAATSDHATRFVAG